MSVIPARSTRFCLIAGLATLALGALSFGHARISAMPAKDTVAGKLDRTSWQQFIGAITPSGTAGKVNFETWASDQDIYVSNPCPLQGGSPGCKVPTWPTSTAADAPKLLHRSLLGLSHLGLARNPAEIAIEVIGPAQGCSTPPGLGAGHAAASSGFPATGCVGEEVRRDRRSFDYLVDNGLWSKAGLTAFFNSSKAVALPWEALEVKADWIPVSVLAAWLAKPQEFVTSNFYTAAAQASNNGPTETYALTSMHISLKARGFPDWIWANFENAFTPGRCDQTGCVDRFGAKTASVPAQAKPWQQYGSCPKSKAAADLMSKAGTAPIFANYCLTGTQTAFGSKAKPSLLGSPIIEPLNADVPLTSSSCISCHAGASFTATNVAPVGAPLGPKRPPAGYKGYDFMWGLLFAKDGGPT